MQVGVFIAECLWQVVHVQNGKALMGYLLLAQQQTKLERSKEIAYF